MFLIWFFGLKNYKALVVFYFLVLLMSRLSVLIIAAFSLFVWFSFAENPTILNPSYTVDGDVVRIYWTDNSNWWYVDVNLQDPETKSWFNFWVAEISDQVFTYTKQWDGDQNIWIIPSDWWDEQYLCISSSGGPCSISGGTNHDSTVSEANEYNSAVSSDSKPEHNTAWWTVTRTVIPVVPKTWPSLSLIWPIIVVISIFGGYIYIRWYKSFI